MMSMDANEATDRTLSTANTARREPSRASLKVTTMTSGNTR